MNGCGEELEIDIGRVLTALWRRRGRILLAAVLAAALTFLGTFLFITPEYRSEVVFYISGSGQSLTESSLFVLETGQTMGQIQEESGVSWDRKTLEKRIRAETADSAPFLTVDVFAPEAGEAKAVADAVARVLPERMREVMADVSLTVADVPDRAAEPASPDYLRNTLIGALAGLFTAGGIAALRDVFRSGESGKYEGKCARKGKTPAHRHPG